MQRVSNVDGSFLISETPTAHMHVMGVIMLAPLDVPVSDRFDGMLDRFASVLPVMPAFRRRVIEVPLGASQPVWVEDPEFDVRNHIKRAALPSPGGQAELEAFVADYASRPLERSKPLWEAMVVEGLEGGRVALVTKLHHAVMDGGAGQGFLSKILQPSPDASDAPPLDDAWEPEPIPSSMDLTRYALREELSRPLRILGAAGEVMRDVLGSFGGPRDAEQEDGDAQPVALFDAPQTSFNRSLTPHRSVAFGSCALEDLKIIRRHFGVTINDVVLAAVTTTLRRYLAERDELPDAPLVASVPITLRGREAGDQANQISMILVALPVQLDDPAERLRAIHAATLRGKRDHQRAGGNVVQHFTDAALAISTPGVLSGLTQLLSASHLADRSAPMWNVVVSNMAGVQIPVYCEGARVDALYPLGPIVDGVGLNFTLLSFSGRLDLGIMACRELVDDPRGLADGFMEAVAEMVKRAS